MTKKFWTHPLDLHEIRSRIASSLGLKDLASCARVSQEWNSSFTPSLYSSIDLSEDGPSIESVERNEHLIKRLKIQTSIYKKLSLTSAVDNVVSIIVVNSVLTTLDLTGNKIGHNEAQVLSEAIRTNSTLTTLNLEHNSIGGNGAQALSEALKTNSTLTALNLNNNSIGGNGAQAL
ncbi:MAG: hypothetical protein BYD32DRAFT_487905 [Podila humilis]|nr:MAG: hypothetical protein BYD32DRAFT_487905 [Podila humilis]